jgi:hypothetical protein
MSFYGIKNKCCFYRTKMETWSGDASCFHPCNVIESCICVDVSSVLILLHYKLSNLRRQCKNIRAGCWIFHILVCHSVVDYVAADVSEIRRWRQCNSQETFGNVQEPLTRHGATSWASKLRQRANVTNNSMTVKPFVNLYQTEVTCFLKSFIFAN